MEHPHATQCTVNGRKIKNTLMCVSSHDCVYLHRSVSNKSKLPNANHLYWIECTEYTGWARFTDYYTGPLNEDGKTRNQLLIFSIIGD